jgi:hypothetical protein
MLNNHLVINLHNEDNRLHRQEKEEMNDMSTKNVYVIEDNYSMNQDHDIPGEYMEINHANHD